MNKLLLVSLFFAGYVANDAVKITTLAINDKYIIEPCSHLRNPQYRECTYSEKNKHVNAVLDFLGQNIFWEWYKR